MVFTAELKEVISLYNILKVIPFNDYAIFRPKEQGLKITTENSKCSEVTVYIPTEWFTTFNMQTSDDIVFKIHFPTFVNCLNIFGDECNPSLKMVYEGDTSPFVVLVKHTDSDIIVDTSFNLLSVNDDEEVFLGDECNGNVIIFNGQDFNALLDDLDIVSDDYKLSITEDPPNFNITTFGCMAICSLNIPSDSDTVAAFNFKEDFSARYNFSSLQNILKVIGLADKISIMTGESGLLGWNLIIQKEEKTLYVEYFFTAQFEDE